MEAGLSTSPVRGADAAAALASLQRETKAHHFETPIWRIQRFAAHEAIFREGEAATDLFEVQQGAVMVLRNLSGGRRQILDVAGPGRLIGLTAAEAHDCSAIALRDSAIRLCDRHHAQTAPGLGVRLASAMFAEIHRLRDLATALGRKTAIERLAGFLIALTGEDYDTPVDLTLPVTRLEIADHLGLAIETVSRNMTVMKRAGFIQLDGNSGLTVCNRDALRQIAAGRTDVDLTVEPRMGRRLGAIG